jgi:hypothetical protein
VGIAERERITVHDHLMKTGEQDRPRMRIELPLDASGTLRQSLHEKVAAVERPVGSLLGNAPRQKRGSDDAHSQQHGNQNPPMAREAWLQRHMPLSDRNGVGSRRRMVPATHPTGDPRETEGHVETDAWRVEISPD